MPLLCYTAYMSETFPPDVQEFVKQVVAAGEYGNEDEVMIAGVRALRELRQRHDELRQDIQVAIDELDRGEGEPLDMVAIKAEVAENYRAREDAS